MGEHEAAPRTLAREATAELEVNKSRFVARAAPVRATEEARAFIARVSDPAATHNCWAFRVGNDYRFFDDGEPAGTAGRPIMGVIDRANFDHVVVVVRRYFGGIKLGTGRLARAYAGVTSSCLSHGDVQPLIPHAELDVVVPFQWVGLLYALLDRWKLLRSEASYTDEGVLLLITGPRDCMEGFVREVAHASRGAVRTALRARKGCPGGIMPGVGTTDGRTPRSDAPKRPR